MERNVWIPRNLAEEDSIKFAFGVRIRPSDMPIMGAAVAAVTPFLGGVEDFYKYSAYLSAVVVSYFIARVNYRGQDLPELILNSVVYGCRKQSYKRKKVKQNAL